MHVRNPSVLRWVTIAGLTLLFIECMHHMCWQARESRWAVEMEQIILTLEVKFPFTEHIWRVGVWRSEQTFHSDAVIYNRCKASKLIHMHVFTDILI